MAPEPPAGIVWPESTDEVVQIVERAAREGTPIVPFGAGSGVCGGVLPTDRTIVIDLKRMHRWRNLDRAAPSLDVEAGQLGLPLEEDLNRRGFTLGHFPSSILCSTVGGWIAGRSAGQCSGYYGKIEDMVLDAECVTGAGEVLRIARRDTGPSLLPIVMGSEGVLAIITSSTLRLHPAPKTRTFTAWTFDTTEAGWEAMRAIFQAGLRPAVCRLYDPFDAFLARMGPVRAKRKAKAKKASDAAPGAGTRALHALLRHPKAFNSLLDARLTGRALGGAMVVCLFESHDESATDDVRQADAIARASGAKPAGEAPARRWFEHRYSISYRQAPTLRSGLFVDTIEVAAPWSKLGALYHGVREALGESVFVMAHLSHAYPDGCCIYFSFAGTAGDGRDVGWDAACERVYDATWKRALDAAIDSGGVLAHHHGVGRSKAPKMGKELGVGVDVVRSIKQAFDPHGILNPGNLIPPLSPDPYVPRAHAGAEGGSA